MVGGYPSGFRGIRNDLQLRSVGLVNVALNLGQFQLKPVKEVAENVLHLALLVRVLSFS